jgi:hypothetical protein
MPQQYGKKATDRREKIIRICDEKENNFLQKDIDRFKKLRDSDYIRRKESDNAL